MPDITAARLRLEYIVLSIFITTPVTPPFFCSGEMAAVHGVDTRALIMGHSHIFCLRRFIESAGPSWPGVSSNFAVDGHGCRVHYIGVCGARLPSLRTDEQWERISILRPQLVVLHVGGNDLDSSAGLSPQQVGAQLVEFANELVVVGVSHVVICQLIRRDSWRHFSPAVGAARVACVNDYVKVACDGCKQVSVWKHKGFWNPQSMLFRDDGVHLNDLGNYKLYRSIRGAILRAVSLL